MGNPSHISVEISKIKYLSDLSNFQNQYDSKMEIRINKSAIKAIDTLIKQEIALSKKYYPHSKADNNYRYTQGLEKSLLMLNGIFNAKSNDKQNKNNDNDFFTVDFKELESIYTNFHQYFEQIVNKMLEDKCIIKRYIRHEDINALMIYGKKKSYDVSIDAFLTDLNEYNSQLKEAGYYKNKNLYTESLHQCIYSIKSNMEQKKYKNEDYIDNQSIKFFFKDIKTNVKNHIDHIPILVNCEHHDKDNGFIDKCCHISSYQALLNGYCSLFSYFDQLQ